MIMQYSQTRIFQIHQTGPATVVSFGPDGCPNHCYHPEYLEDLSLIIKEHNCETLIFDFSNVNFLASGLVGLLACIRKRHGVQIEIRNPSSYIQTALEALQLTDLLTSGCEAEESRSETPDHPAEAIESL